MPTISDLWKKKQPFCWACQRWVTPAEARSPKHSGHARLVQWPKPPKKKK